VSFITNILGNAAGGFIAGGPAGAIAGGLTGLFGGSAPTGATNASDAASQMSVAQFEAAQTALQSQQLGQKLQDDTRSAMFNEALDNRSETMRESNELRTLSMEQRKADIKITDEFIKSIT